MDIDHIFTAYERPLTMIAIQGYVYKIMNKMFKRSINKNKHDTKKQQLMPPPCFNACLIKETTGFMEMHFILNKTTVTDNNFTKLCIK
jgi:hypothetical protein